ncbi:hypothetical protein GCM10018793_07640 [Streptomyces sulfonofaciens]|uniref:Uncharacterized protein n=1 Tax=Streptomyces sulfonofaciens TaxID=68272 RepID=A0A919FTI4_9ACTN|nr:hypothetical protein GCM10018793_07640 [Streptomyces sulfonofaciens]
MTHLLAPGSGNGTYPTADCGLSFTSAAQQTRWVGGAAPGSRAAGDPAAGGPPSGSALPHHPQRQKTGDLS